MMSSKFQVPSYKSPVADLRFQGSCFLAVMVALALVGCSSTKPATSAQIELSRMATQARAAFERGSVSQAARLYLRTLKMARVQDDPVEIGNNAYNLAACLIALKQYDDARNLLREAKREFDRVERPIPSILLLDAKAARLQGNLDEAMALSDQVLVSMKAKKDDKISLQVLLLKTHLACDRDDIATAKREMKKAQKMLKRHDEPILKADAAGAAGRMALLEGDPERAAREYDGQVDYFKRAEKYQEMALSLSSAGEAYGDAGLFLPATDRFYRSARSLYAQGDKLAALNMVEAALASGQLTDDKNSLLRTQALFEEIKKQVEDSQPAAVEKKP